MKKKILCGICLCLLAICGCTGSKEEKQAPKKKVMDLRSSWSYGLIAGGIEHEKSFFKFYDDNLNSMGDIPVDYEMLGRGRFGQSVIKDNIVYEYSESLNVSGKDYEGKVVAYNLKTGAEESYEADGNFIQDFCIIGNDIYTVGNINGDTFLCKTDISTKKVTKKVFNNISSCVIRNILDVPCIITDDALCKVDFEKGTTSVFYKLPKEWMDYSVNFYGQSKERCYIAYLDQVYVFSKKGYVTHFTVDGVMSKMGIVKEDKLYLLCDTKEGNPELVVVDTKKNKEISRSRLEHSVLHAVIRDNALITLEDSDGAEHLTKYTLDQEGKATMEKDVSVDYDGAEYSLTSLF